MTPIEFTVPMSTRNPLNNGWGHWSVQASKRKKERAAVLRRMPRVEIPTVFVVTLTRVGTRLLDDDNLGAALKSVRDAVAHRLGVDDGKDWVRWQYAQKTGEPCMQIRIEEARR